MLKALTFGLGAGAAVQAWRQWPADGPVTMDAGIWLFIAGLVVAYLGGRARRGSSATAVAVASAEAHATAAAQNTVNVVFAPGQGAGAHRAGEVLFPTDAAPWLDGQRASLTLDQVDGMDLTELVESRESETSI